MVNYNYFVWVEIEANKQRILDEKRFAIMLSNCEKAGIGSIVLSVKDTTGFGIYESGIVPHYSQLDRAFERKDYLQLYIDAAHRHGLKLYAGIDVFSEGRNTAANKKSPGVLHTEWQTELYGIADDGSTAIRKISDMRGLKSVGAIDDFNEIFVNPAVDAVQDYEASIVKELIGKYALDGIVLDRVRFVGLSSDFSGYTRKKFEEYTGRPVENWPQDIFILQNGAEGITERFGDQFGEWIEFRASIIKKFILKVRGIVDQSGKNVELIDYTGSWYPLYYLVGANWASRDYHPEEYKWVKNSFSDTGYAEDLDKLMSGFYYPEVTIEEAQNSNRPAYWYSVEGSAKMAEKVTMGAVPIIGSLFLRQYKDDAEQFKKAVHMCFEKSSGCMLFDLSYLDDFGWWDSCRADKLFTGAAIV
jgi:Uncharacterized protein conserved in bacteria